MIDNPAFQNFTPRANPPKQLQAETSNEITPQTLATLDTMDAEALRKLVQRMARQCGMVAAMSEEQLRVAFLDRMAHIALTAKALEALAAMEKRMNRTEGTPIQRQQSMVAIAGAQDDRIIEIIHVKP